MKKKTKKTTNFSYRTLAFIFLFLQAIVIVRNIFFDYSYFFWLCDFAPILYFFSFLFKKTQFVKGIINLAFFPQIVFLISFIFEITGGFILGSLNYSYYYISVTILFHLASIIAISSTYQLETKKESLIYSTIILIPMFFITYFFTSIEANINYVYFLAKIGYESLVILWIPLTFLIVVIPTYYFQKYINSRYG
jgi:hypothetical protein